MYHRCRQGSWKTQALLLLLSLSVAAYVSPAEARSAGGRAGGGHFGDLRGGAVQTRFGGGFHGGVGQQVHRGVSRPSTSHPFRSRFAAPHRFHHRSSVFFNLGGFVFPSYAYYPSYPYYPPYPAYSAYPAYPIPYDPGYSVGAYPYLYPDPVAPLPQSVLTDVQVYTAPPEPPPASPRQPAEAETPRSPVPLEDGSLHFEVAPPEAKIFIDERYLGEARELANIAEIIASAGRHLLEIRVGAERTFMEVVVSPHKVTPVRLALDSATAASAVLKREHEGLRLQIIPPGAAIYLDGAFAAVAKSADWLSLGLSPGQHRLQVVMPGHREYATDVLVPEGGEAVVAVQLARE